jgi:hypothetical protein
MRPQDSSTPFENQFEQITDEKKDDHNEEKSYYGKQPEQQKMSGKRYIFRGPDHVRFRKKKGPHKQSSEQSHIQLSAPLLLFLIR